MERRPSGFGNTWKLLNVLPDHILHIFLQSIYNSVMSWCNLYLFLRFPSFSFFPFKRIFWGKNLTVVFCTNRWNWIWLSNLWDWTKEDKNWLPWFLISLFEQITSIFQLSTDHKLSENKLTSSHEGKCKPAAYYGVQTQNQEEISRY